MLQKSEIIQRLKGVKLFQNVPEHCLEELASHVEISEFRKGQFIIKQNKEEQTAYIVHSGKVSIHIDALLMSHYGQGTMFGEFSMLDGTKYSASAVAQEPTVVIGISREVFYDQLTKNKEMTFAIIRGLVRRLRRHLA